jgi:hypothetical protein
MKKIIVILMLAIIPLFAFNYSNREVKSEVVPAVAMESSYYTFYMVCSECSFTWQTECQGGPWEAECPSCSSVYTGFYFYQECITASSWSWVCTNNPAHHGVGECGETKTQVMSHAYCEPGWMFIYECPCHFWNHYLVYWTEQTCYIMPPQ